LNAIDNGPNNPNTDPIGDALLFLKQYNIESLMWNKVFNTITARNTRRDVLKDVNKPDQIIFYVDADEFPIFYNFSGVIDKLSRTNTHTKNKNKDKDKNKDIDI